jgi:hypothetical protein
MRGAEEGLIPYLDRVVFLYWIVPVSCGFSVVVAEQAAESFPP